LLRGLHAPEGVGQSAQGGCQSPACAGLDVGKISFDIRQPAPGTLGGFLSQARALLREQDSLNECRTEGDLTGASNIEIGTGA
jgi:hypothetical protein